MVEKQVKAYARANPHSMGAWSTESKSHVAHMSGEGDFYASEQSYVVPDRTSSSSKDANVVRIEHVSNDGVVTTLKAKTPLQPGEVIDASRMDVAELKKFYAAEIDDAREKGVLFSLHLKATMMKVSDPVMFGHCVETFYRDTFAKHGALFKQLGVDATNGLGDVYAKIEQLPAAQREAISKELEACLTACDHARPQLAMVDSDKGVTNLHVPSDVIIDASIPAAIRESGKMFSHPRLLSLSLSLSEEQSLCARREERVTRARRRASRALVVVVGVCF